MSGRISRAEIHALVHAMNEALGARGNTLELIEPVAHAAIDHEASLTELVSDMQGGSVNSLLIIDSNPVFTAPAVLGFAAALQRVDFSVALAPLRNETSRAAAWAVPKTHSWETGAMPAPTTARRRSCSRRRCPL